eukprot:2152352-Amphidinium_carterae.1
MATQCYCYTLICGSRYNVSITVCCNSQQKRAAIVRLVTSASDDAQSQNDDEQCEYVGRENLAQ